MGRWTVPVPHQGKGEASLRMLLLVSPLQNHARPTGLVMLGVHCSLCHLALRYIIPTVGETSLGAWESSSRPICFRLISKGDLRVAGGACNLLLKVLTMVQPSSEG